MSPLYYLSSGITILHQSISPLKENTFHRWLNLGSLHGVDFYGINVANLDHRKLILKQQRALPMVTN
jgi:hypothetical protein